MDGQSLNIKQNDIARLRELFPHIFSEDKLDPEKFKAAFGDAIDFAGERYTLNWAGKADAYRILQERTAATLKPQPELSVNFDATENVFIEGENLEVLKVLQKSYYNKIKCIIIDPPYNTGSDSFIYPDRFKENLEAYEKRVGERDEDGYLMKEGLFRKNSKENGHYHSNWLSMMFPRLFLARNLMRDDGVIFVHIDDNEVHNLRMVMNEVFGEYNFVGMLKWKKKKQPSFLDKHISTIMEYVAIYSKNINQLGQLSIEKINGDSKPLFNASNKIQERRFAKGIKSKYEEGFIKKGIYRNKTVDIEYLDDVTVENYRTQNEFVMKARFRDGQQNIDKYIEADVIYITINHSLRRNVLPEELEKGKNILDLIDNWGQNQDAFDEMFEMFQVKGLFDNPKPSLFIKNLIKSVTEENDFILDFFAGSGTTAQAVFQLNAEDGGDRRFILVQLPELCDESGEAYKSGYKTIADLSRERIRRVIQKLGGDGADSGTGGLGFKSYKLSPSNFKIWRSDEVTEENIERQMDAFIDPAKPESRPEDMLVELILKSGYKLTEKFANCGGFYYINNELVIALTEMTPEIAAEIMNLSPKPQKVIVLDRLFAGDDELKTNTALQMRDAGVGFRTI